MLQVNLGCGHGSRYGAVASGEFETGIDVTRLAANGPKLVALIGLEHRTRAKGVVPDVTGRDAIDGDDFPRVRDELVIGLEQRTCGLNLIEGRDVGRDVLSAVSGIS